MYRTLFIAAALFGLMTPSWSLAGPPTDSGLDLITEIINSDEQLLKRVSPEARDEATQSAYRMNEIILDAIFYTGSANDNRLSAADTRTINSYIYRNHGEEWIDLHGDDDGDWESGFHLVRGNGNKTLLFGKNAINTIADSIYHLGFEGTGKNKLTNEDGRNSRSYTEVSFWLSELLVNELETGVLQNPEVEEITAVTGTGLDMIIDTIYSDESLESRISLDEMREAAYCANEMNLLIVEAIEVLNLNQDGFISDLDAKEINRYLHGNHADLWSELHGDDDKEAGTESGYHLVQNDGSKRYLFGEKMVDKVFDGLYHLGFEAHHKGKNLLNEDGNKNASFDMVAYWLDTLINHR